MKRLICLLLFFLLFGSLCHGKHSSIQITGESIEIVSRGKIVINLSSASNVADTIALSTTERQDDVEKQWGEATSSHNNLRVLTKGKALLLIVFYFVLGCGAIVAVFFLLRGSCFAFTKKESAGEKTKRDFQRGYIILTFLLGLGVMIIFLFDFEEHQWDLSVGILSGIISAMITYYILWLFDLEVIKKKKDKNEDQGKDNEDTN